MTNKEQEQIGHLMLHYMRGRQDMDTRRTRKNGWNEIITAYMGKLPANWPFLSTVVDPRLRTSIVEKGGRIINSKLRGRLVPRNDGNMLKAKINNAILDFQWDYANEGGSMLSKVQLADQYTRLFGASFALTYWSNTKNTNDIKIIDPRDISFDGAATHIKNARWVQVREFTTWEKLSERGYNISKLKRSIDKGEVSDQWKSTSYESIVKGNRGLTDRTGEPDDPKSPIVEIVTEWTNDGKCSMFLPRFSEVLEITDNPYKHGQIPVAMLRYHPLIDDIYGETDAEYVLPLQRAINAELCGFIDEMTIAMRPPLKIASDGVRTETIEYGPGAQWIMDNPSLVQEMQFSSHTIANFNTTYPALVQAFNNAMGDTSLGIPNKPGTGFGSKTATEVQQVTMQQNNRDQNNQLFLGEFLKDIMMMWLSNNRQYILDDPTKSHYLLKIVGKDKIAEFVSMGLADTEMPQVALDALQQTIETAGNGVTDSHLQQAMQDMSIPKHPVILNPNEKNPENYDVKPKLEMDAGSEEANLYIVDDDFVGEYDYIPDVQSMGIGALTQQKQAMDQFLNTLKDPGIQAMMQAQGVTPDIKGILIDIGSNAGMTDAENKFKTTPNAIMGNGNNPNGQGAPQSGQGAGQLPTNPGMAVPQGLPGDIGSQGLPGPQGLPGQAPTAGGPPIGL
jgi:hypothetical protein